MKSNDKSLGWVTASLREAQSCLEDLISNSETQRKIAASGQLLVDCFAAGHRVYSCGNGGSMCDAMHFAEELSGKFREERPPLPALAISDPAHLSCVANDFGYEEVFARSIAAHGSAGDVLLAITTSGSSENVLRAARTARSKGMKVIGLTGRQSSPLAALCDIEVCTPGRLYSDRVQELHIKVIHILIDLVEKELFGT